MEATLRPDVEKSSAAAGMWRNRAPPHRCPRSATSSPVNLHMVDHNQEQQREGKSPEEAV
ncbi:hypothetical protein EJB05_45297 [Eragrostis curvula]|uniref:Uncharacterized protein n=1 Tax=Eragrostis curvula TaxID=38414 RepID=A0A5J9TK65_9POAL|nr:hypothetical protein EJB05_45297 [Eragrostis curvula]